MIYRLHEDLLLRGWQYLPCTIVNKKNGHVIFVSREDMAVLELANGRISFDLPFISDAQRKAAAEMADQKLLIACEREDPIDEKQKYRFHDNRYMDSAHWSVTGRCNYTCRHCYMSACENKYGELSHETVMKIIDEFAECGIYQVSLTGGEALVRADFFEMVDALTDRDIFITTVYSNGRLVNEKTLSEFEKRGLHPEFNMSFDGTEGWHAWLRGVKDADSEIDRAFRLCREHGFPTGAEMCIHDRNKHTLRDSVNYLASVGCRSLKTNPVSDEGTWHDNGYGRSISNEDLFETYLEYVPHYYEDGEPLSIMLGGFFSAVPSSDIYSIPTLKPGMDVDRFCVCGHARKHMYISPEGRVMPCLSLSGMDIKEKFPLVTERGLKECLTDSSYIDLVTKKAREVIEHNTRCKECEFAKMCCGGCRAAALATTPDDILGIDESSCLILKGGYVGKIDEAVHRVAPDRKRV